MAFRPGILAESRGCPETTDYKVLFALLAGAGLRVDEALGLKLAEHLSGGFSTSMGQRRIASPICVEDLALRRGRAD